MLLIDIFPGVAIDLHTFVTFYGVLTGFTAQSLNQSFVKRGGKVSSHKLENVLKVLNVVIDERRYPILSKTAKRRRL